MAGKQAKWLDSLLSDTDEPASTSAETPRVGTLLTRETAIARVASGEVRSITRLELDPERVRVWPGNARIYENLTEANTRELIDAIVSEGGQKVPAVVRRVDDDPNYQYEVIAGTRRHWAISWLRKNSYPQFKFVAIVEQLDDEAAFRLADIENRARKDVSDLERARNYRAALQSHYEGRQDRMAERLKLSRGWLSKMIKVAALPDPIVAAFGDAENLSLASAYPLAQALDDKARARLIAAEARVVAREQTELRDKGLPPYSTPQVVRRLLGAKADKAAAPEQFELKSNYGRNLLTVSSTTRQGVTIKLHAGSGADRDEVISAVGQALEWLEQQGRGLV